MLDRTLTTRAFPPARNLLALLLLPCSVLIALAPCAPHAAAHAVLDTPEARAMAAMFGVNTTAVVDALSGDLAGALLKSECGSPWLRVTEGYPSAACRRRHVRA
jgi:hypothetical protein